MNETRDLIIGIDLGKKYSQICYYDRKAEESRSLPVKVGSRLYETPTCLCRRADQGDYCIGLEAEYFAREKGGFLVEDLYHISMSKEKIQIAGEQKEPWELLGYFLKGMLQFLGVSEVEKNIKYLTVTMETMDSIQVKNLQKAAEFLGIEEEKFSLLDYEESFYYYVLTQKIETWNRSVGWYSFKKDRVLFRKLAMSSGTKPVFVRLVNPVEASLRELPEERDEDFYKFIKETLGTELYSSIQMNGEGFDQEWAVKSVKLLCYQKRKVFYGNNLFAAGACGAGAEKCIHRRLKGYRYLGSSLVVKDVGMEMRVMGAPVYYPLLEAGTNWYECKASCELILDNTEELVFVVGTMGETEKKRMGMLLPGIPKRPNKTTRISLKLQYISRKECQITVKDLGFGEMFPSSGKVWEEIVQW